MILRVTPCQPTLDSQGDKVKGGEAPSIDEMQREIVDSQLRINSLRIALQRAENDIYKVERLRHLLLRGKISKKELAQIAYLLVSCIVPDLIKWLFRPLTRYIRRISRRLESYSVSSAYQVRNVSAGHSPARVLHAIANFKTGGSSRLVVDIVERLGHIYQQEVLTGFVPAPSAYRGILVRESRSPYEIVEFMEKFRPDLLHVHYWGDVDFDWYEKVFDAAAGLGCKVIENVNTPVAPCFRKDIQRYVYVSDYVMRNFGSSGKGHLVIHPGSDLRLFSRKGTDYIPENCIGMVYRLEPDKLNLQSIDVFVEVAKRRPNTTILIVGDGSFLERYKQVALAQGVANSFCFMGSVPYLELPSIYARMSIFVAPVWKESFGQVSPFAMSMGIPVVGYRVGGLEEIVNDDDLLTPSGDATQLANIIIKLLGDRERRRFIGERNRVRAQSLFTVEKMTEEYEALYRSVIAEDK